MAKRQNNLISFGLLLVAVPVVLQFALLSGLLSILWSIEQESLRARESRNRISRINDCMMSVTEFSYLLVSARKTAKKEDVFREIDLIEKQTISLLGKQGEDAETQAQLKRVKATLSGLTSIGQWMLETVRSARTEDERLAVVPRLAIYADKFTHELSELVELEKKKSKQVFGLTESDLNKVRDGLIVFVGINILSSVFMAVFFAKRIKTPINRISTNLKLLSKNEPLMPALDRKDELGSLDRLIHSVASELNNAHVRERALIDKAADLICSLDEAGIFLTVNPMASQLLDIQPSDLIGTKLSDLTKLEDTFAADELIRSSIKSNDFQTAELTLRKHDGSHVETRWSCLWSDQESSLFCVAHDVTTEKELERTKQNFMNMISHDLRSPLSSVMGGLVMLTKGIKGASTQSFNEEAESAVRSAEKLISFIDDLLDFQKLSAGEMPLELESHKAQTLIEEAVELVKAYAKDRSIELKFEKEAGEVSVVCDRQKVIQVLVNLLSNAIKFSPAHSVVQIEVEETSELVDFAVCDDGPGVPDDMKIAIFEPFQQTSSTQHQGTGLGLAICKMIVEAHGGSIGVAAQKSNDLGSAEPEKNTASGSQFRFSIPKSSGLDAIS